MGRCLTLTFVLSGVLLAGIGYFLYEPLPGHLDNVWRMRIIRARLKAGFILNEVKFRLGYMTRLEGFRSLMQTNFNSPLTEADKAELEIHDIQLDGVPVRIYKPKSTSSLLPGLVFYHGGGWVLFDVPSYDGQCAHIARKTNIIVISVEYRLAPEFPFPVGFEDCLKVARHVLLKGKELGIDSSRVAVGGDSAGGNLAAAVSTRLRDDKVKPALKAQILIYGALHYCELDLPSWKEQDAYDPTATSQYVFFLKLYFNLTESQTNLIMNTNFLTKEHQDRCFKNVDYRLLPKDLIPEGHKRGEHLAADVTEDVKIVNTYLQDLRFAPMLVDDVSNLPATFVLSAGWDKLRDENIIYAERLRKAGNTVELLYIPDTFHGILNSFVEEKGYANGPKLMKEILVFINKHLK